MINASFNNQVIIKRVINAFTRDELNGCQLVIPSGFTHNEALIINEVGREILNLIDGKRTILDIITEISNKYPEVAYSTIQNDAYNYINHLLVSNLIRFKEADAMYKGHVIGQVSDYEIYRCSEGDFKLIYEIFQADNKKMDVMDATVSESLYTAVNLRAKLFNYYEDYYILRKDSVNYALVGIVNGRSVSNNTSYIGRIILLDSVDKQVFIDFLKSSLIDYKQSICQDARKIRFSLVSSQEADTTIFKDILNLLSFKEVANLKDEFGDKKDLILYDYFFVA